MRSRTGLWAHPDFLRLWTGQTVSQFGSQLTLLAVPLTAITVLNASTFQVGLLTTFEMLPFLLFGLPAGVWVDRSQRRAVLILADIGRMLAVGSIPLTYAFHALQLWQLYVVVFVTGVLTVFFDVAYQSYLAPLVGRDHLVEGNAKLEVTNSAAQIGGPGIGGVLLQLVRAPALLAIDALSFAISAVMVWRIRLREPAVVVVDRRSMRLELVEGLRYVLSHRWLRAIAACTGSANLFGHMTMAVFFVYMVRELGLSNGTIGLVLALGNGGWLIGALIAGPCSRRLGVGRTTWLFALLAGGFAALVPLATRGALAPVLLIISYAGTGLCAVVYNVTQISLRQVITPDRLQGRMNATIRFLVWGTMPIGSLLGGTLGTLLGLRTTLWIAAAGGALTFLPVLLSPVRHIGEMPTGHAGELATAEPNTIPVARADPV